MKVHTKYTYYSPSVSALDKDSSALVAMLYRTNQSIKTACEDLEIEYQSEMTDGIEQCSHCSIWYYDHELIEDLDGNILCKFCEQWYGR